MDYNLALKLKNAGFPQDPTYPARGLRLPAMEIIWSDRDPITKEGNWRQLVKPRKDLVDGWEVRDSKIFTLNELKTAKDVAKVPTLEELIDACGNNLKTLYKINQGNWWVASNQSAEMASWENFEGLHCDGVTPSEAVSRLWLALNVNKNI